MEASFVLAVSKNVLDLVQFLQTVQQLMLRTCSMCLFVLLAGSFVHACAAFLLTGGLEAMCVCTQVPASLLQY